MAEEETPEQKQRNFLSRFNKPDSESKATNSHSEEGRKKRKWADDGWGGRGGYMKAKSLKLNQQYQTDKKSDIFAGVAIYVNGYTVPSSDELKRLVCENGGQYNHYFSKTFVTHTIATNLPDSKIKNMKKQDKVLHPNWIVDSVEKGRLLAEDKYLLYSVAKRDGNVINFKSVAGSSEVHEQELVVSSSVTDAVSNIVDADGTVVRNEGNTELKQDSLTTATSEDIADADGVDSLVDKLGRGSGNDGDMEDRSGIPTEDEDAGSDMKSPNLFDSDESEWVTFAKQLPNAGASSDDVQVKDVCPEKEDDPSSSIPMVSPDLFDSEPGEASIKGNVVAPVLTTHEYTTSTGSDPPLKAGDENYIEEFYAHSRLHHLSMWKAELKKFTASIQEKWKTQSKQKKKRKAEDRLIMHVDMDSFFATVAMKMNPELRGKPVAVCHSGRGTSDSDSWSEIASCNYEARQHGLRNGMLLKNARPRCPQLVCVPYQFDQYRLISQKFYEIVSTYTNEVEAVSCDEVLLDVSDLVGPGDDVLTLAESIRRDVLKETGCTVSCGVGNSILIARLATRTAKPDGKCYVSSEEIGSFILTQSVENLPGIGYSTLRKLETLNVTTCADLQQFSLTMLQKEFGQKFGEKLHKFSRGVDEREIRTAIETKSVSAEINYGMRFTERQEVEKFTKDLSKEVERRLEEKKKKGKHLTLKLMIAQHGSSAPAKYMGHGKCDCISKSVTLPFATDDALIIGETCVRIMKLLKIAPQDYRGIGIQLSKLVDSSTNNSSVNSLSQFAKPVTADQLFERDKKENRAHNKRDSNKSDHSVFGGTAGRAAAAKPRDTNTTAMPTATVQVPAEWDPEVLKALPQHIQEELLQQQSRVVPAATTSVGSPNENHGPCKSVQNPSARSPANNKSPSTTKSPSSRRSPITTKSPSARKSPLKRRGRPRKLIDVTGNSKISFPKVTKTSGGNISVGQSSLSIPPDSWANDILLSPSQLDQSVLQALPPDIREDVLYNAKKVKTGRTALGKHRNTITTYDSKSAASSTTTITTSIGNKGLSSNSNPCNGGLGTSKNPAYIELSSSSESNQSNEPTEKIEKVNKKIENINLCSSSKTVLITPEDDIASLSELNQSVLSALPEDIREEVVNAHISNKDSIQEAATEVATEDNFGRITELNQSVLNALPEDIRDEVLNANSSNKLRFQGEHTNSVGVPNPKLTDTLSTSNNESASRNSHSLALLSPSQIDVGVLNVLPASIQREVVAAAKNEKQKKLHRLKENQISEQMAQHVSDNQPTELPQVVTPEQNMPMLYGTNKPSEIKKMLRNWVDTFPEPLPEDIDEITDYFVLLLSTFNMESLYLLVLFLRRIVRPRELWHSAFNKVLASVQVQVKSSYSGRFPIDPF